MKRSLFTDKNCIKSYRAGLKGGCFLLLVAAFSYGKTREIKPRIPIRQVNVRNIAYGADGTVFAVPNIVSAGSVALFEVSSQSEITSIPSRLSEKDFVHSSGLFYLRKKDNTDPFMAFIALPELLRGYTVDFSQAGTMLAVAGGNQAVVYNGSGDWEKVRSLTIGVSVTRAVFSPDGSRLAVIADGKIYLFSTETFAALATIEPVPECTFCDVAFSNDNTRCAAYEFRTVMFDAGARIRIFSAKNGRHDRDFPPFPVRPSEEPQQHLPLLSYAPGDTLIAATVQTAFTGKVFLVRSNDGTVSREYKGYCHAFSPDGSMFVAQGKVFSTEDWSVLGTIPRTTRTCAFSPTEPVVICATLNAIRRFRIEGR